MIPNTRQLLTVPTKNSVLSDQQINALNEDASRIMKMAANGEDQLVIDTYFQ